MTSIAVELPEEVFYVAGTVNGVLVEFEQDKFDFTKWRTYVTAAQDDRYHIKLELHDEAGNVGYYENTMEYILPVFVYDRTQEDIDHFRRLKSVGWERLTEAEKQEWLAGLKGCLNMQDLKRIENNLSVIAGLLNIEIQTNKNNLPELPDVLYFGRMLNNVETLRKSGFIFAETPQVPEAPLNTWQKVNDVEKILHDVYVIFLDNQNDRYYCGETFAGENTGLL